MELLKKSYATAAVASGAIVTAMLIYAVVVEFAARSGFTPPVTAHAAAILKFMVYIAAASSYIALRTADRVLGVKRPDMASAVKALTTQAIARAALCEMPAVLGLVLFLLTGLRADFYMLLLVAAALEIYHFPRLAAWEERLRSDFGQLPQQGGT